MLFASSEPPVQALGLNDFPDGVNIRKQRLEPEVLLPVLLSIHGPPCPSTLCVQMNCRSSLLGDVRSDEVALDATRPGAREEQFIIFIGRKFSLE
jgi:hypothetical protein